MISFILPNRNEERVHEVIAEIERLFPGSQVIIAVDRDSRGKGWAVRRALSLAEGEIVCFLDADMDIEPRMALRLLTFIHDYDIVVGRKNPRGRLSRRLLTRLSRLYIWLLFGMNIDTQTGVKMFWRAIIPEWQTDDFSFDVEVLAKAKRAGRSIIEVPVEVHGSKPMKIASILKCLWSSFKIWKSVILAPKSR